MADQTQTKRTDEAGAADEAGTPPIDLALIESLLAEESGKPGSLMPLLQQTQDVYGYLPADALRAVSDATRIPLSRIYGVATFYGQFSLKPRGKHTVRVCRGTACHASGGNSAFALARHVLGVDEGETTSDMQFTLETVACLGACALAPVVVLDGTYFGKVTAKRMEQILARVRNGKAS